MNRQPQPRMNRRAVLGVLATGAAGLVLPGCAATDGNTQPNGSPSATGRSATGQSATGAPAGGASASGLVSNESPPAPVRIPYGDDGSQWGELHLPAGDRRPGTVVIVHGGFWLSQYGADLGTPLAADLARRGWCAWNLEYRRVGNGGGWPNTLLDVAAGVDQLAELAATGDHGAIDLNRVVAVGHSAGGQLAAWLAGRPGLDAPAPGATNSGAASGPAVAVTGVVSQAGVLDLTVAASTGVGGDAVTELLGGSPVDRPERYRIADPIKQLPLGVPVHCVHSKDDGNVPYAQSTAYVAAAQRAGDPAELHQVDGDHFTLIDPSSPAWAVVVDLLPDLCGGSAPASTNPPASSARTT